MLGCSNAFYDLLQFINHSLLAFLHRLPQNTFEFASDSSWLYGFFSSFDDKELRSESFFYDHFAVPSIQEDQKSFNTFDSV